MGRILFICQLCQEFCDHPTSKCPDLICKECHKNGHGRKDCPVLQAKNQNPPNEYIPTSPVYNPDYYDELESSDVFEESTESLETKTESQELEGNSENSEGFVELDGIPSTVRVV